MHVRDEQLESGGKSRLKHRFEARAKDKGRPADVQTVPGPLFSGIRKSTSSDTRISQIIALQHKLSMLAHLIRPFLRLSQSLFKIQPLGPNPTLPLLLSLETSPRMATIQFLVGNFKTSSTITGSLLLTTMMVRIKYAHPPRQSQKHP